jgi:hypothetical protein
MARFDVTVKLVGKDGNAFAILGNMIKALRKAGATPDEVKEFQAEATSGDYNNLLQTCCKWANIR